MTKASAETEIVLYWSSVKNLFGYSKQTIEALIGWFSGFYCSFLILYCSRYKSQIVVCEENKFSNFSSSEVKKNKTLKVKRIGFKTPHFIKQSPGKNFKIGFQIDCPGYL